MTIGDKLGPYEITALLGKGGMGEVYRATDTRLHRDIAIKVSAEKFTDRFEKEARAVAALNHPNVSQLYDVGSIRQRKSARYGLRAAKITNLSN